MAQALLMGNFEAAVEMCLAENKMAEAILLAIAGGPELLLRTQKKYFQRNKSNLGRVSCGNVVILFVHCEMFLVCDVTEEYLHMLAKTENIEMIHIT